MKKLNKNTGFTLVEMLIVVAIIAILVAVSIPLVSSSLENARIRTDEANERAAKAEAAIIYLMGDDKGTPDTEDDLAPGTAFTAAYDAVNGKLTNYSSPDGASYNYGQCSAHDGNYVKVDVNNKGTITITWSTGGTGTETKAHPDITD